MKNEIEKIIQTANITKSRFSVMTNINKNYLLDYLNGDVKKDRYVKARLKEFVCKTLSLHNEWRRGGEGEQTDPSTLGVALDLAVVMLRN